MVYIYAETQPGEDVFIRGGVNHDQRPGITYIIASLLFTQQHACLLTGCTETAETSACAIVVDHASLGSGSHYEKYDAWKSGDNFLDWYGAETNQGSWQSQPAEGTPTVWTTNEQGNDGYQPDNQ